MRDALSAFCGTGVGDVGVAELRAWRQTKCNGRYVVLRAALYPSAIFDEM